MRWSVQIRTAVLAAALAVGTSACLNGTLTWKNSLSTNKIKILTGLTAPISMTAASMLPEVQAKLESAKGEPLTSGAGTVYMLVYTDAACTLSPDPYNPRDIVATATMTGGLVTFPVPANPIGHSGVYYLLLAMDDGSVSDCSPAITVSPGPADHMVVGTLSEYGAITTLVSGAGAQTLDVQVVDQFGNIQTGGTGCTPTISISRAPTAGVLPTVGTIFALDANGHGTVQIDPGTAAGVMSVTASGCGMVSAFSRPIGLQAAAATNLSLGFVVAPPGNMVPAGNCQLYKLKALDAAGNVDSNFSGTVSISGPGITSNATLGTSDHGQITLSLCPSTSGLITASYLGLTGGSLSVTVDTPACGGLKTWTGAVDSLWANAPNWDTGTAPTSADMVRIASVATPPAMGALQPVACANLASGAISAAGTAGLAIYDRQMLWYGTSVNPGAFAVKFMGTSLAQTFYLDSALPSASLSELAMGGSGSSLSINNQMLGPVEVNTLTVTAGNTLYLSGSLVVVNPITVPAGATLVIGPGAFLRAKGGMTISFTAGAPGVVVVMGGGMLQIENGTFLTVNGTLALLGDQPTQSAMVSVVDTASGQFQGSFGFNVSGTSAKLAGNYFSVQNGAAQSIAIGGGATQVTLINGLIRGVPEAGKAIVFAAGTSLDAATPYLINLGFEPSPSAVNWTTIDATGLGSKTPIVNAYIPWAGGGTGNPAKTRSIDPWGMLVWDRNY